MSIDSSFFKNLDSEFEKAEQDAESWEPTEAGETLKGIFLEVDYVKTQYGWSPLGIIRDVNTNNSLKVWMSAAVLRNKMEALKPAPGTPIAIRFDGMQTSDKGRNYKKYVVAMPDREEGDVILGREYWDGQEQKALDKDAEKQTQRAAVQGDRPSEAPF